MGGHTILHPLLNLSTCLVLAKEMFILTSMGVKEISKATVPYEIAFVVKS